MGERSLCTLRGRRLRNRFACSSSQGSLAIAPFGTLRPILRFGMRTKGGGFPDRRRKFQGKLTLILQDLFFLPSRAARVFAVIVHQKSTMPAPKLDRLRFSTHHRTILSPGGQVFSKASRPRSPVKTTRSMCSPDVAIRVTSPSAHFHARSVLSVSNSCFSGVPRLPELNR